MTTDPTTTDLADQSADWLASNLADPAAMPSEYQFHGRRLAKAWIEMRSELVRRREDEGAVTREWLLALPGAKWVGGYVQIRNDRAVAEFEPWDDASGNIGKWTETHYGVEMKSRRQVLAKLEGYGLPTPNPGEK